MMTKEDLKKWAFKNNKFVTFDDGESITAILKDAKPTESKFDPEKEIMRYFLKFPDGNVKTFENGSPRLADIMANVLGKTITITRVGTGTKTKYEVVEVNEDATSDANLSETEAS